VNAAALRVEGLCKRFGDADALNDVSLEVCEGEVLGLVGGNGAGKSTLLKVLAGVIAPDAGQLRLRGAPVRWRRVRDAADAGIGLMAQEPSLVPGISVAENILLGHEGAGVRLGIYRWRRLFALAQARLDELGMSVSPAALTQSLSFPERQGVAFAKALAVGAGAGAAPILLLDEPTSALDERGAAAVMRSITQLRRRASVVFVSHRLDEILQVSDRIVVMRDGRCVAERDAATSSVEALLALMAGPALTSRPAPRAAAARTAPSARLELRRLSRRGAYADISLVLQPGEVLGLAGAAGSGCEALCRTLFGIDAPDGGTMRLDGRIVTLRDPGDAIAHGIGYVAAERAREGIIGAMSVAANLTLAHLARFCGPGGIDRQREQDAARHWIDRLRIKTPAAATPACRLSGGNQQKVAFAKWLVGPRPRLLILDHPLRGLDAPACRDILDIVRELARDGVGIVLVADTIDELLAVSDTVIVMRDGRISARCPVAEARQSRQAIVAQMA